MTTGVDRPPEPPRRGVRFALFHVAASLAALATLISGLLVLATLGFAPYDGSAIGLLVVKALGAVGWLTLGWWQLRRWMAGDVLTLIGPVAAWCWAYVLVLIAGVFGALIFGP